MFQLVLSHIWKEQVTKGKEKRKKTEEKEKRKQKVRKEKEKRGREKEERKMREEQTKSKNDKGARKRSCLTTSRQLQENFTKELSLKLRILFPKENKSKLIPNFTFF